MAVPEHDWYLSQWLHTLAVRQSYIVKETGWPKSKVSKLVNGHEAYTRDIVNSIARALRIAPFELLLHPEDAMAIRRMRDSALQIAADTRHDFNAAPPELAKVGT